MVTSVEAAKNFEVLKDIFNPANDLFPHHILPNLEFPELSTWMSLKETCTHLEVLFNDEKLLGLLKIYLPQFSKDVSADPKLACKEICHRQRITPHFYKGLFTYEKLEGKKVNLEDLSISPDHDLICLDSNKLWNRTTKEYVQGAGEFMVCAIGEEKIVLRIDLYNCPETYEIYDRKTREKKNLVLGGHALTYTLKGNLLVFQLLDQGIQTWNTDTEDLRNFPAEDPIHSSCIFMKSFCQPVLRNNTFMYCPLQNKTQILIKDLNTGERLGSLKHLTYVNAFLVDHDKLYADIADKIFVWDLNNYTCVQTIPWDMDYKLFAQNKDFLFGYSIQNNQIRIIDKQSRTSLDIINFIATQTYCKNIQYKDGRFIVDSFENNILTLNFTASDSQILAQIAVRLNNAIERTNVREQPTIHRLTELFEKMPEEIKKPITNKVKELRESDKNPSYHQNLVTAILSVHSNEKNSNIFTQEDWNKYHWL